MDWLNILQQIFELCIIPLLAIITRSLIIYISTKKDELKSKTDNELAKKYLDLLNDTIANCVIATNQTYVEALKKGNAFTADAQKAAFEKTYQAVIATLSDEAQKYLPEVVGDLQTYITQKIEASVNQNKAA
jgi:hypothetical protein